MAEPGDQESADDPPIDRSAGPAGAGLGERWDDWLPAAAELLAANRVEVDGHRYTRPAPIRYEQQWLWDSCFHAIANRWIDPAMAWDELLSLVARQVRDGPDAGLIPHLVYWRGGGEQLWGQPDRSSITQPPLIAVAAMLVHAVSGARERLATLYPRLCAYHAWLDRRRDPDGDGLVSIIHPWESGWDAAPRWDRALGLANPTDREARRARLALTARVREHAHDAAALARAGLFHVEAVDFNAIRAADLEALAAMARVLKKPAEARRWLARAAAVQAAVRTKLVRAGPRDLEGTAEVPSQEGSAAGYIALFGGCASPAQARRLVARLRSSCSWPRFPVATTPTDATSCDPERYWRGNVWPPVNWLIFGGLKRYGYGGLARELARRTARLIQRAGFWEYYHPLNGQGLGAHSQSWATLVVDMLAADRRHPALGRRLTP